MGQLDQILSKVMGITKSYNTVQVLLCILVREWQSSTLRPALSPLVEIPYLFELALNLDLAPILRAEKVNKLPGSNKRPSPPPSNQTQISATPTPPT